MKQTSSSHAGQSQKSLFIGITWITDSCHLILDRNTPSVPPVFENSLTKHAIGWVLQWRIRKHNEKQLRSLVPAVSNASRSDQGDCLGSGRSSWSTEQDGMILGREPCSSAVAEPFFVWSGVQVTCCSRIGGWNRGGIRIRPSLNDRESEKRN